MWAEMKAWLGNTLVVKKGDPTFCLGKIQSATTHKPNTANRGSAPQIELSTCKILCGRLCGGAKELCVLLLASPVQGHFARCHKLPVEREHL